MAGTHTLEPIKIPVTIKYIGAQAFAGANVIADIPDHIDSLRYRVFENSTTPYIKFPKSLKYIGYAAFRGCDSIVSIILPDSVYIEPEAFSECSNLDTIGFTEDFNAAGYRMFENDPISCVKYYGGMKKWIEHGYGKKFFNYYNLYVQDTLFTNLVINDSLIEDICFAHCKSIKSVTLGDSVKEIRGGIYDCPSLDSICFGESLQYYNKGIRWPEDSQWGDLEYFNPFEKCNITKINIRNSINAWTSLTYLNTKDLSQSYKLFLDGEELNYAVLETAGWERYDLFYGCQNLDSVYINNLDFFVDLRENDSIGTFGNCSRLKTIKIANDLCSETYTYYSIADYLNQPGLFNGIEGQVTVQTPSGLVDTFLNAEGWKNAKEIIETPLPTLTILCDSSQGTVELIDQSTIDNYMFYSFSVQSTDQFSFDSIISSTGSLTYQSSYGYTGYATGRLCESDTLILVFEKCKTIKVLSNDSTMGHAYISSIGSDVAYFKQNSDISLRTFYLSAEPCEYTTQFSHWSDGNTEQYREVVVNSDTIFTAYFTNITSIENIYGDMQTGTIYDLTGKVMNSTIDRLPEGIYIIRKANKTRKIYK